MTRGAWFGLCVCIAFQLATGCNSARRDAPSFDETAKEKVKAMKSMADELEKDQEGPGARAALEQFRVMALDAEKHPEQAKEIADIYRQRIQGKFQGSVARELQSDMTPYLPKKK